MKTVIWNRLTVWQLSVFGILKQREVSNPVKKAEENGSLKAENTINVTSKKAE